MNPLLEVVPNFSEGRDADAIAALADVFTSAPDVALLDYSADADHHRSVFTAAGRAENLVEALLAAAAVAVERIDLRLHHGAHPRIGALDVAPFIPLDGMSWLWARQAAETFAEELWRRLRVPSYFYGEAARRPERARLEEVRRGGFEALREVAGVDPARAPDVGGPSLHPSAGATAVGVRHFLVAFNVNLRTTDIRIVREIARLIRTSSGGYPALKALGLELPTQGLTQVSMNFTDIRVTPLQPVVDRIVAEAAALGAEVAGSELIGLAPRAAFEGTTPERLLLRDFREDRILEHRLAMAGLSAAPPGR